MEQGFLPSYPAVLGRSLVHRVEPEVRVSEKRSRFPPTTMRL
jgi:hypothetical protein